MPSYDKEKLLRLLEQRRRAHVALRDLSDRREVAKQEAGVLRGRIFHTADGRAHRDGVIDRLLGNR